MNRAVRRIIMERFAEEWAKGTPVKDITKEFDISRRTALYWRLALGLPSRRSA
jgi:hypothetical protein